MHLALGLIVHLGLILVAFASPIPEPGTSLVPRQYPIFSTSTVCCKANCKLELDGNGNVHTLALHKQVTENLNCGDGTCTATFTDTYTRGFTIGGGLNVGFFSAGLDVAQSWSDSRGYECDGGENKDVCIWMRVFHAVYSVTAPGDAPICGFKGKAVMKSPLKNNPEGGFYCVRGDACRKINDEYWCTPGKDC